MMTKPFKAYFLSWLPAWLGMAALFYASSLPGDRVQLPPFPYSDKAGHFSAYAALGMLISLRKPLRRRLSGTSRASGETGGGFDFMGLTAGLCYGVCDEIHQIFVPGRSFDYGDMGADAAGVVVGCWVVRLVLRRVGKEHAEIVGADLIEKSI